MMRTATLLAATVTNGMMAGLFFAFSVAVLPGLRHVDDRAFVDAMQRVNAAILNGWFGLCFGGTLLLTVVTAGWHLGDGRRRVLGWVLAALLLYALVLALTFVLHVPLNDALAAAGPPGDLADPAAVRAAFEDRWTRWNVGRTVLNVAAFGCLCVALVQHGRAVGA